AVPLEFARPAHVHGHHSHGTSFLTATARAAERRSLEVDENGSDSRFFLCPAVPVAYLGGDFGARPPLPDESPCPDTLFSAPWRPRSRPRPPAPRRPKRSTPGPAPTTGSGSPRPTGPAPRPAPTPARPR